MEDRFSLTRLKILLTVLYLAIYILGAGVQGFYVNTNFNLADQEDYMARAVSLRADLDKNMTDGNRMPLYPLMISLVYRPGLSMDKFFQRAKIFNIALSILLLFLLYLIFRNYLVAHEAKLLLLIVALTVFMPRAGYVQCELLYYFLAFWAFLLYWSFLKRPDWQTAAGAGILGGLSFLAKGAALPAVVWFVGCVLVFYVAVPMVKYILKYSDKEKPSFKQAFKNIMFLFMFVLLFLMTVSPYIQANKRVFGHYFYNVNSTFYIWYDSWREVKVGTRAHGDRLGWPQMPADEIPSASKYLRKHTPAQIAARWWHGLVIITTNALGGFGYAQYFFIYLFVCIMAISIKYQQFKQYLRQDNRLTVATTLILYFLLYFGLYTFGADIFKGPRHPLAQFIPGLFLMFYFLSRFGFSYYSKKMELQLDTRKVHIAIFCLLMLDLAFHMPYRLYKVFSGW